MSRLTEIPGAMLASVLRNVLAATNSFSPYRPVLKLKKRKEKNPPACNVTEKQQSTDSSPKTYRTLQNTDARGSFLTVSTVLSEIRPF